MTRPTTLKRVAHLRAGGTPAVDDPKLWDDDAGVEWVSIGDMTRSRIVRNGTRRVSERGMAQKRLPIGSPGTVLFAMYASLGAVAVLGVEATWNQAILGVQARDGVANNRFIAYWLEHLARDLSALARSNTQDNLNAGQVANLPFPTLAVEDQRRIADFLDAETARIDALIEKKRRMIKLLDERLSQQAWFLVLGGADGTEPAVTSVPRDRWWWSHRLPDNWRLARLIDLVRATNGHPFDSAAFNREGRGTRLIRIRDLMPGAEPTFVDADVPPAVLVRADDVVIGMDGEFNVARWDGPVAALNQRLCRLDPLPDLDVAYLTYVLPLPLRYINDLTFFTTVKHLATGDLLAQRIPVPPIDIQARIVRQLDGLSRRATEVGSRLARQIELLLEHRQALITAAVTGQLDLAKAAA